MSADEVVEDMAVDEVEAEEGDEETEVTDLSNRYVWFARSFVRSLARSIGYSCSSLHSSHGRHDEC
jgi:hypothetical protein